MASNDESDLIRFNVGGISFILLRRTLSNYPKSLPYQIVTNGETNPSVFTRKTGEIFIDRDPQLFAYIAQILRQPIDLTKLKDIFDNRPLSCRAKAWILELKFYKMISPETASNALLYNQEEMDSSFSQQRRYFYCSLV